MELFVFILFAGMALTGAVLLVTLHNLVRSVLAMILSFIGIAGLYLVLEAEFLAAIQVLVYVGAVAVLVLFAVMLTQRLSDPSQPVNNGQAWLAFSVATAVFVLLTAILAPLKWPSLPAMPLVQGSTETVGSVTNLGIQLLSTYAVPFEVASLILLIALLGSIMLARE
jgi:NADH:ubiquinone oxidoreductase subunit 6 (subunit J)